MEIDISKNETLQLLISESEKLKKTIENIQAQSKKTIPDIVNLYYQATMVKTLSKKIKSDLTDETKSENQFILNEIDKTQKNISENFSRSLHPEIFEYLTNLIQTSTKNLKS